GVLQSGVQVVDRVLEAVLLRAQVGPNGGHRVDGGVDGGDGSRGSRTRREGRGRVGQVLHAGRRTVDGGTVGGGEARHGLLDLEVQLVLGGVDREPAGTGQPKCRLNGAVELVQVRR